jgi:hypothetical protein
MCEVQRRDFLKLLAAASVVAMDRRAPSLYSSPSSTIPSAARILNEYTAFLPGEQAALAEVPKAISFDGEAATLLAAGRNVTTRVGDVVDGWHLLAIAQIEENSTAIFEKHATHRGAIAFVTVGRGTIAQIPKWIGDLASIRPRQIAAPADVQLRRAARDVPGPDVPGDYILSSADDPCYENVSALGPEYIGWTLVANEQGGPETSLYLQADGASRELNNNPPQAAWAPDELSAVFDPRDLLPFEHATWWPYEKGYSKRTLLAGYLPVADIGVWNRQHGCGYEAMVLLPEGVDAKPASRVRIMIPENQTTPNMKVYRDEMGRTFVDHYRNGDAASFFSLLLQIWRKWSAFFEESMPVDIPDEWLLAGARAGLVLCRCSYRGLEPTYQIGEGAYTKIPERSHALFPVAHYEFIWAHQLWNLTSSSDAYFQHYLDKYVLLDGNFVYNTQDQVEAPICVGLFLANSTRGYFYERNLDTLQKRLPVLRRMVDYVLERYDYSKRTFAKDDPHYGLIFGSPEADYGDPNHDAPSDHPYFYENAAGVWRGLKEYGAALTAAAILDSSLADEAVRIVGIANEMRGNIQSSLNTTLSKMSDEMKSAAITPFTPEDVNRNPVRLESYENHRFMQDWFLADWGDPTLDLGHLNHRKIAGLQLVGLHLDGADMRTSNFMEHGTLAVRIRQQDYRPYLLTLFGLVCFAADSGNRYSPEDAYLPGGFAGEGPKWCWSSVVNSALQSTVGLRWLLCYEESDRDICHLQKAAPKHWFNVGEHIAVNRCPTRFGHIMWRTDSLPGNKYTVHIVFEREFAADLYVHIHPATGEPIRQSSIGRIENGSVVLDRGSLKDRRELTLEIT